MKKILAGLAALALTVSAFAVGRYYERKQYEVATFQIAHWCIDENNLTDRQQELIELYDIGFDDGYDAAFEDLSVSRINGALVLNDLLSRSVFFTTECYNPLEPDANARPDGTDQTIYMELDGIVYELGMYQG